MTWWCSVWTRKSKQRVTSCTCHEESRGSSRPMNCVTRWRTVQFVVEKNGETVPTEQTERNHVMLKEGTIWCQKGSGCILAEFQSIFLSVAWNKKKSLCRLCLCMCVSVPEVSTPNHRVMQQFLQVVWLKLPCGKDLFPPSSGFIYVSIGERAHRKHLGRGGEDWSWLGEPFPITFKQTNQFYNCETFATQHRPVALRCAPQQNNVVSQKLSSAAFCSASTLKIPPSPDEAVAIAASTLISLAAASVHNSY